MAQWLPILGRADRTTLGDFRGVIETTDETECIQTRTGSIPSRLTTNFKSLN
jgi:hypothetical protein